MNGHLLVCCDVEWFEDMLPISLITILMYFVVARCSEYRDASDARPEVFIIVFSYIIFIVQQSAYEYHLGGSLAIGKMQIEKAVSKHLAIIIL